MADVVHNLLIGAGTYIHQVMQSSFDQHIQTMDGVESGAAYVSDKFVEAVSPEAAFTTSDIGGFLDIFGTIGGFVASGANVAVPWQKRSAGGIFAGAGANAIVRGIANCPVQYTPLSVTAPRMGAPTAQGGLHFLSSDGITLPFVIDINQDLVAGAFQKLYGLGPMWINGVRVPAHVGYTVNFGVGYSEKQHYDGAPYPVKIFIETVKPSIEVTVEDFDLISSYIGGSVITDVTCYLRKRASGSTYVADGTAVHVKFNFAGGIAVPQSLSAADTKHGQAMMQLQGLELTGSTAAAVVAP